MLRNLLTSSARMSSRSLFTKSNASIYVPSHRTFSDKKEPTRQKPFTKNENSAQKNRIPFSQNATTPSQKDRPAANTSGLKWIISVSLSLCIILEGLTRFLSIGKCRTEFYPKLPTSMYENAAAPTIKNNDPFKGAKAYLIVSPWAVPWTKNNIFIISFVHVKLPNIRGHNTINEISEGLKLRGIDVECSESGVRRGLAAYVLKQMQDGVEKHLEKKKCSCGFFAGLNSTSSNPAAGKSIKKRDLFEGAKVKLSIVYPDVANESSIFITSIAQVVLPKKKASTTTTEICDGLRRRGIQAVCTKEGVHAGLATYALKQLHHGIGKHLEENSKCGYFTTISKASSANEPAQSIKKSDRFDLNDGFGKNLKKKCNCGYFKAV